MSVIRKLVASTLALSLIAACGAPSPSSSPAATDQSPEPSRSAEAAWRDAGLPSDDRAQALLATMTADEKIGQMTQLESGSVGPAGVSTFLLGSVLSGGDGGPADNDPEHWYRFVDAYQQAALETRLGIPILFGIDAVHGASKVVGATIFPHNVGLGAMDDPELVERIGTRQRSR